MPTLEELRRQRQERMKPVAATPIEETPQEAPKVDVGEPQGTDFNWQKPADKFEQPEWQAARQNPQLLSAIKRYAKNVENEDFSSDDQAFDWFVGDRRWKDSNTMSTLKELNYVKGTFGAKYASEEDLQDLATIKSEWDKLPGGFTRIARGEIAGGAGAILENIAKGTVDPSIILGGLGGKAVGAAVTRGGSAVAKQALKRTLQTSTAIATDATISAGADLAAQEVNVEAGLQDEINGWEALVAGGLGAALSAPGAISTFKPSANELKVDPLKAAEQAIRVDKERRVKGLESLFGDKGTGQVPDGRKLTTDDVDLMKQRNDPNYKPSEEDASFVDLGYDVDNLANVTRENINLARSIADTVPGISMSKDDFFKWWGKNNQRIIDFKAKHFNFADNKDFEINAKVFQETFPELFQSARRGEVSDKQTEKEALALAKGRSNEANAQAIINTPIGYAPNAAELQFGKLVLGGLRDDIQRLKQATLNIDAQKVDDAALDLMEEELNQKTTQYVNLLARQAGFESELGRGLRSVQVAPTDSTGKATKVGIKAVRTITGTAKTKEERAALLQDLGKALSMLDPENQQQLDLFVANLHQNKSNLSDVFYEMYYNWGLLSNPSTQVINLLGNMANLGLESTERGLAAAFTPGERMPAMYRFAGYGAGMWDAVKAGIRAYKTELPSDPQTRLENMDKHAIPSFRIMKNEKGGILPQVRKAGVGEQGWVLGGKQARIPGRFLLGVDDAMKLWHQRAYIYEQMYRAADAQGLKSNGDRKAFYKQFLANTPSEVLQGALEEGRRLTYTDKLGPGLRGFQQFVDAVPGGRLIIPFVRTPAKILNQAADMMSLPMVSDWLSTSRTASDWAAGGIDRKRAMARITMGYSLLGLGAYMAANGLATGSSPSDPGERETFNLNQIPWGVRAGNEWIQYNRFDPVAIPITFGVGLEKTLEAFAASGTGLAREESYLSTMAGFMSDAVLDKSFFQGVENVVGAIMEPERKFESFTKGVVRSFTPAITAGYARASDPRTTAPLTFMEVIQDRIGFEQRKKVPTKVDGFGRDVWIEVPGSYKGDDGAGSFVNRFINPFKAKSGANDPIANELYDLGVKLTPPRKKYKDIELDSEQTYILQKASGKMFYDILKNAMASPDWKDRSPAAKRLAIDTFKQLSSQYGQTMLEGVYPELVKRSITEDSDIKKLTAPTRSETLQYLKPNSKR